MDNKIGFEMSLIVVEAIRGRCASFTFLTATVWEIIMWWTDKFFYFSIRPYRYYMALKWKPKLDTQRKHLVYIVSNA